MNITFSPVKFQSLNNFSIKKTNKIQKNVLNNFSSYDSAKSNYSKGMINFKGCYPNIPVKEMEEYIRKNPTATIDDISDYFNLSVYQFQKACVNNGFDYGKEKSRILKELKQEEKENSLPTKQELETFMQGKNVSIRQLAKHFNITMADARECLRKYCKPMECERKTSLQEKKVDVEEVREFIESHPKLFIKDISEHFDVVPSTINRIILLNDINYIPKQNRVLETV